MKREIFTTDSTEKKPETNISQNAGLATMDSERELGTRRLNAKKELPPAWRKPGLSDRENEDESEHRNNLDADKPAIETGHFPLPWGSSYPYKYEHESLDILGFFKALVVMVLVCVLFFFSYCSMFFHWQG
jgi:hypothetical protein